MTNSNTKLSIPIGKGSFGYVNLLFNPDDDKLIARKVLINNPQAEKYIHREIENMKSLKNTYGFVHMISHTKDANNNETVDMDFIPSGSLRAMLKNVFSNKYIDGYDSTQEIIVAYGIAFLMSKMHKLNKIHRDLKPDNILLDHNLYPHICDFGLARDYDVDLDITRCGTRNYIAPEVLNGNKKICIQSDVYMLGMTMYEMVELTYPYQGLTEEVVKYKIFNHVLPEFSESNKDHRLIPVIKQCWELDPNKRPSMEKVTQLLSDIFINDTENFLDKERFTKYVNFLKDMDTKTSNEIPNCGTIKNLRIAAQRGNPFSIDLLSEAVKSNFNFMQEKERIEKILRRSANSTDGSESDNEEEEYDADL